MKRCGFILLCALVVLCVLLAGCGGKTAERSEAGEVFAFCGGEAENFAKTFDVNEMNCMEYRYTMDTPVSCRITDKAAMQTILTHLRGENRRKNGHACNGQRAEFDVCENRRHDVCDTV